MKFALLWMYFEGQACGAEANPKRIREFAISLYARKTPFLHDKLKIHIDYFKTQASEIKTKPENFINLLGGSSRIKPDDRNAIVSALTEDGIAEVDKVIGVLLICLRVRNNLFHGAKLVAALQKQESAFFHTGQILITLLEAREA